MNFAHPDIRAFLHAPHGFQPPAPDAKKAELSIIMACCLVVRSLDERPRRLDEELSARVQQVRDSVGAMDSSRCAAAATLLLEYIAGMGYKLVPVPLLVLKTLTWALVDVGVLGVPDVIPVEDANKEIENCRKALELVASELCLRFGVPHKSQPN